MKKYWVGIVTERYQRRVYTSVLTVEAKTREEAVLAVDSKHTNSPLTGMRRIDRVVYPVEALTGIPVSVLSDGTIYGNGE